MNATHNDAILALGARGFVAVDLSATELVRFDRDGAALTLFIFEAVRGVGPVRVENHATGESFAASLADVLDGA